jgi:hypothetical protein
MASRGISSIYLDALGNLCNSTESVEGREGNGGELERNHGCLSVRFSCWCGEVGLLESCDASCPAAQTACGNPKAGLGFDHRHATKGTIVVFLSPYTYDCNVL